MNVLILNPVHPGTPHISAVRAFRFAQELSKLGHRVVLATSQKQELSEETIPLDGDWRQPFVLEIQAPQASTPKGGGFIRRAGTAFRYVVDGGWDYAWGRAVVAATLVQSAFTPDVIWVSFGKMEAVLAARKIARTYRVPWVLDVKDNWELFVPCGLRHLMVRRTRGWTRITTNSRFFGRMVEKWQGERPAIIYSGIEETFLGRNLPALPHNHLLVNLIGGLYFEEPLNLLMDGIEEWSKLRGVDVTVRYLGVDGDRFSKAQLRMRRTQCASLGYLATSEMANVCAQGHVNAYVRHPGTFHHKLLELACIGRPLLACPSDDEEAHQLANEVGVSLHEGRSVLEIIAALDGIWAGRGAPTGIALSRAARFRWSEQAVILQGVLQEAVEGFRT